jgi:hypothetical protein
MREIFASGRFFQRFQGGEFLFEVHDLGPALTRRGESMPSRYRDQTVRYFRRDGQTVAIVHQRAGDEFGNPAPGTWADPKYVLFGRVRYGFSTRVCRRDRCVCAVSGR